MWVVSQAADGEWGCSCPVWKYRRKACKHIEEVRATANLRTEKRRAEYRLAMIRKPVYLEEDNVLLIPLVRLPDTVMMEATIIYNMLLHGFSWSEIRSIRHHVPRQWSAQRVIDHVQMYGEAEYPPDPLHDAQRDGASESVAGDESEITH